MTAETADPDETYNPPTATAAGPSPFHRRAGEVLAHARATCEPALRESVGSLPDPLSRMAGYHFGWWDPAGTASRAASGKALRPALVMCTAATCGEVPDVIAHVAAAVELIHNFSLVHDDVIDGDSARRGRPTVWKVWGVADAVLLGDALHALANRVLAAHLSGRVVVEAIDRLETAVIEMCQGQHEDCALDTGALHKGRSAGSALAKGRSAGSALAAGVGEYEHMAMGKTGALMGCACALGALCVGADAATVSAMDGFGRELGLAFQFADDLIGIWGDPAVTGKPGSDLARRKRSLPVVAALGSGTEAGDQLAALYESETPMTPADVARAAILIETAGGREQAQQYADKRVRAAIEILSNHSTNNDLMTLAYLVAHRDR